MNRLQQLYAARWIEEEKKRVNKERIEFAQLQVRKRRAGEPIEAFIPSPLRPPPPIRIVDTHFESNFSIKVDPCTKPVKKVNAKVGTDSVPTRNKNVQTKTTVNFDDVLYVVDQFVANRRKVEVCPTQRAKRKREACILVELLTANEYTIIKKPPPSNAEPVVDLPQMPRVVDHDFENEMTGWLEFQPPDMPGVSHNVETETVEYWTGTHEPVVYPVSQSNRAAQASNVHFATGDEDYCDEKPSLQGTHQMTAESNMNPTRRDTRFLFGQLPKTSLDSAPVAAPNVPKLDVDKNLSDPGAGEKPQIPRKIAVPIIRRTNNCDQFKRMHNLYCILD